MKQQGFTTLELMIVTAIIGVMAGLGVTNYGVWKARADLKAAITVVQNELLVGRMTAMSRNIPVTVTIMVVPTLVTMTTRNANDLSNDPSSVLASSSYPIAHVAGLFKQTGVGLSPTFSNTSDITTTVTFNSMGFRLGGGIPGTENQLIAISNDRGLQYTVRITARGGVSWCPNVFCQGTH